MKESPKASFHLSAYKEFRRDRTPFECPFLLYLEGNSDLNRELFEF